MTFCCSEAIEIPFNILLLRLPLFAIKAATEEGTNPGQNKRNCATQYQIQI
jgi:hypothetical protein